MGLANPMPSSTRQSRKVVNYFTQPYPTRGLSHCFSDWLACVTSGAYLVSALMSFVSLSFYHLDSKIDQKINSLKYLYIQRLYRMRVMVFFRVTWHFPPTCASKVFIPAKWQLLSLDSPDEQKCHNHVFALDWRWEITSNDSVLVIKFHVSWHL